MSYVVGTAASFRGTALLTKSCQYPVSMCLGSVPVVVQPLVVPVALAEPDSPVPLYARTVYVCVAQAASPLIVALVAVTVASGCCPRRRGIR